jgi:hypothetical protein
MAIQKHFFVGIQITFIAVINILQVVDEFLVPIIHLFGQQRLK